MQNVISVIRKFMVGAGLLSLAVLAFSANPAFGQGSNGIIVGTVKDVTGAVVPNATVTATNVATSIAVTVKSGQSGDYNMSNLLPGTYDLSFSASGFAPYKLSGLAVDPSKSTTANANLIVATSSSVEVEASAGVTLDTTTNNLTTNLTSEELSILPTASVGNGVLNASLLAPNVASGGGAGIGTGPSVGGQRPRNNNYTIEGVDVNDKSVTGPLIEVPNDAVADFTLITSQFSPEFGHSSGGQFNTTIISGTNHLHGRAYEYFENRDLNAENGIAGGKNPNTRFDRNRYGGQVGGPIFRDKLFFFANYERTTVGQSQNIFDCTPTAAGVALLNSSAGALGFNATNLAQYLQYTPAATTGATPIDPGSDEACFTSSAVTGQYGLLTVGNANWVNFNEGTNGFPTCVAPACQTVDIPLGNAHLTPSVFSNTSTATGSLDFTPTPKDQFRFRYNYLTSGSTDTIASIPTFQTTNPFVTHFMSFGWFHDFTPNLINEARLGFNREFAPTIVGPQQFPGLTAFPNFTFFDMDIDFGPDDNAPQSTIQNFYQLVDNVSYVRGRHTMKFGFDGRKYIAPTNFIQRQRGDYEWNEIAGYFDDLAPDAGGERSSGAANYYGDQTAFYGYGNDTWRVTDKLTLNYGLRYEFTSVPVGERRQALNSISNTPGLIVFNAPQPNYKNFAPRVGIAYALDEKTSIRAGFGIAYDVLFDNLGTLSGPPQFTQTHDVGNTPNGDPDVLSPGFLAVNKGLSSALTPITSAAAGRKATAAYLPDQVLPYSENYNITIQRVFAKNYTAEIQYLGTRGVHLAVQNQLNVTAPVTAANQLTTYLTGPALDSGGGFATINTAANVNTLGAITASEGPGKFITPAYYNAGYFSKITSYQPFGGSNYNGLGLNVTRRFINGFQMNASYTWAKALDDSTAEVNASELTQRRPQDSRNEHAEYARSALDRTQRLTLEAVYDLPYFKHSNFLLKNVAGNWEFSPIYTYETPEYVTPSSELNSNLNNDSGGISRTFFNTLGDKQIGSGVVTVYSSNPTLVALCGPGVTRCAANTVGYLAKNPAAGYITSGAGTIPNAERNTMPGRPIDNVDLSALKRISFGERYSFEFIAQAFNLLNHAQYVPGSLNDIAGSATAGIATGYLNPSNATLFNNPTKEYTASARSMQLVAKFNF